MPVTVELIFHPPDLVPVYTRPVPCETGVGEFAIDIVDVEVCRS
jgi:hypothetical protein